MVISGPACMMVRTTSDRPANAATIGTSQIQEMRDFCLRAIWGAAIGVPGSCGGGVDSAMSGFLCF
ncbi:Uncharacterised protein [Bordetella pertussis]|nr:Uncharacterised protein [Bordetella pertussis]